ncbi:OPT oligopeptide transporter protein [Gemmata obscuriglobus]|uniref:Oligopeptide transporter, OPT family n=1 Tax=Gemmata obscuriglobus TaxID=114 RepID=A0A2Z3HD75_9BACT|nr:oligopeptide transporter, OPT family [Gemmata obscuriglobus]AWM40915.1 oligopeptide transporter, OPT family [Gemmata obscuriglobus]QEG25782.1 OPT oligopeptide transporter protein [Gemmata obscuriglobus]VTR99625.1 peptide transporter : Putative oligopeptide transporter, OPT family OS=Singulisphaera acidiphila (strain ATCC BAA-1392 / DSM 18658 / VKM B-2454 / MOB10) GN=Sinac_1500 PE=4 SV=1: OPT: OPT [Gemmata obscuriglobus UQM 2246]
MSSEVKPDPGFQPFVPASEAPREFTLSAVAAGTGLGLIFAASSLYLVLKVGMTVSASIPVAVLAITVFRALSKAFKIRQATVLENNIVQTAGSAGESIAFGVGVSMPALLLLGFGMDLGRVMVVSILGGLLGILVMIPLRRAFIVKMHFQPGKKDQGETLLYPEGTACAQVLISGEKGGTTGKTVFIGFGLAFLHKFLTEGMNLFVATAKVPVAFINKAAVFSTEMASELLGVGYIIGLRTAAMMMGGAVLGYLVILPIIYFVGENNPNAIPPGVKPIKDMSLSQIRNAYLLYIGAGCVASAGIISMLKTLPLIVRSFRSSLSSVSVGAGGDVPRTDRDMPMSWVLGGTVVLVALLALFLASEVSVVTALLGALLVVLFGFLFVTVSARLTGEIGSSSNPISGMTTATLMITCLIFLALGMTSPIDRVLALSVAAVVCIASSNGGTVAQSLKTGYLVGGTPRYMQYAIMAGAFVSALVIGGTLIFLLNKPGTVYSSKPENVPPLTLAPAELARLSQTEMYEGKTYKIMDARNGELIKAADGYKPREEVLKYKPGRYLVEPDTGTVAILKDDTIMGQLKTRDDGTPVERKFDAPKTRVLGIVINGVLSKDLNWTMVAIGAMIAVMLELCGVSALAFAVGLYVPIQFSVTIFIGGVVRWAVDKKYAAEAARDIAAAGDDPAKKAQAEVEAIRKAETSPGVLLASGYIAGGSIAGVLIAFLAFSDTLPRDLSAFQYRSAPIGAELPLEDAAAAVAGRELPDGSEEARKKLAGEIVALNEDDLPPQWVKVPAGTKLKIAPGEKGEEYTAPSDTTLGAVAKEKLGRTWKAAQLLELNKGALKVPEKLPAQAEVFVPQPQWATLIPFGLLVALLAAVGLGLLLRSAPEQAEQAA